MWFSPTCRCISRIMQDTMACSTSLSPPTWTTLLTLQPVAPSSTSTTGSTLGGFHRHISCQLFSIKCSWDWLHDLSPSEIHMDVIPWAGHSLKFSSAGFSVSAPHVTPAASNTTADVFRSALFGMFGWLAQPLPSGKTFSVIHSEPLVAYS